MKAGQLAHSRYCSIYQLRLNTTATRAVVGLTHDRLNQR